MERRKKEIEVELFALKCELNCTYGSGQYEQKRYDRISDRIFELRDELTKLNKLNQFIENL